MGILMVIPTGTATGIPGGIKANMSSAALKLRRIRITQDGLEPGSDDALGSQSYDSEKSGYFKDAGFGNLAEDHRDSFSRG
jgi:hypothetical protein